MSENALLHWLHQVRIAREKPANLPPEPEAEKPETEFQSHGELTLGVEIELQLIDCRSLNLTPRAEEVLDAAGHLHAVKPELYFSTVEINTAKCDTVCGIEADLKRALAGLNEIAAGLGVCFSATGSHPSARYSDCLIRPTERYLDLIDRNQWLARRMTVYGQHVHIGRANGDDCIRYNNFFMYFTPHLLALSASSPYWQGEDTGLSSCRSTAYEALPTAGQPYRVRNWKDFEQLYESLKKCGSVKSLKDLWWDLRPSPKYGTLELRVCDGCATLYETLAIVAFIHALAHWFRERASWVEIVSTPQHWLARENKWRAIRYGLDAELVMNTEGRTKRLRDDIGEWLERLAPYADALQYGKYFSDLKTLMARGTSSERQRRIFERTGSLEAVTRFNVGEFVARRPTWDAV
jgi:glutamate---cysteine ligase / carboxylate-amine ligase